MKIKKIVIAIFCIIIVAQTSILFKGVFCEKVNAEESTDYIIKINYAENCVSVYSNTNSIVPVKTFTCSVPGENLPEIVEGTVTSKTEWIKNKDNTFSRYSLVLSNGINICTTPYSDQKPDKLIAEKYNVIGNEFSGSNVWLNCSCAKWIYENVAAGVKVNFISEKNKNKNKTKIDTITMPIDAEYKNWDPTDDDINNPWKEKNVEIKGFKNMYTKVGEEIDLLSNVTATDTCGNDVKDNISVVGNYDFNKAGEYELSLYLEDATGSTDSKNIKLVVSENESKSSAGQLNKGIASKGQLVQTKTNSQKMKGIIIIAVISFIAAFGIIKYTKR